MPQRSFLSSWQQVNIERGRAKPGAVGERQSENDDLLLAEFQFVERAVRQPVTVANGDLGDGVALGEVQQRP